MTTIISLYFALCIIAWAVDVTFVLALVIIKPLRKWIATKVAEGYLGFYEICKAVWPEDFL